MALWCWTGKTVRIPLPPRRGITLPFGGSQSSGGSIGGGYRLTPFSGSQWLGLDRACAVPEKHGEVAEWTKALAC